MKKRNADAVDLFKWICAFFVVYIHMKPLSDILPMADSLIAQGVCRIAVPFFFCASAWLLFSEMENSGDCGKRNGKRVWKFCKHILAIYTVWSLVYMGYRWFHCWYNGLEQDTVWDYLRRYFLIGERYHLWYLLSSVLAVPAVYGLWRAGEKALLAACLAGNLLQCVDQFCHWGPLGDIAFLHVLREEYLIPYAAVMRAIPMMSLGVLCLLKHEKYSSRQWLLRTILLLVPFMAEAFMWNKLLRQGYAIDGLFVAPVLVYCLANWLFTADFHFSVRWLGKAMRLSNTWIYCSHVLWIFLYGWVFAYEGVMKYAAVVALSLCSCVPYVAIKLFVENKTAKKMVKKALQ